MTDQDSRVVLCIKFQFEMDPPDQRMLWNSRKKK